MTTGPSIADLERDIFALKLAACVTMEDRIALFLQSKNDGWGFWIRLADKTGISSKRWRHVAVAKQQRITSDMVESLCRCFPEYAFWIVTGQLPDAGIVHAVAAYG